MKIYKTPSNLAQPGATTSGTPEQVLNEAQLTIGVVLVAIAAPPAFQSYSYTLINRSAGGQIIRVGVAPSFVAGAIAGISLRPNEAYIISSRGSALNAIADGAGALLDCEIRTP